MSRNRPSIRSERTPMAGAELAAFERRVARAYQNDMPMADMRRQFHLSDDAITVIVKKFPNVKLREKGWRP